MKLCKTAEEVIMEVTGVKPIDQITKANEWNSWYRGKVDFFHNYRLFNGKNYVDMEKKSLLMAKTVCEDWADLLANENNKIAVSDDDDVVLNEIFERNNFRSQLNRGIENTFAVGNGAFLLGLTNFDIAKDTKLIIGSDKTDIRIDFINYFDMRILNIDHNVITECAFISHNTNYDEVSIHTKNELGNYIIRNFKITEDEVIPTLMIDTKSPTAWFFHIKPNINNNSFISNNLGMSIFANAIDVLKGIDDIFDAFTTEYVLARMKVFVSAGAYKMVPDPDNGGKVVKTFDPYDTLFYDLPVGDETEKKPMIQTEAPTIRDQAYLTGINTLLNLLSKKCGFGTERYKFDKSGIMTATQVISENSDMARSLRKHENLLRNVLKNMTFAIKEIVNNYVPKYKLSDFKYSDINVMFDDSIIEDKGAIQERDRLDVQAGLMSRVEYRMKHYGQNKEDAEEDIRDYFLYDALDKYTNALQNGVITPEEFVEKVYGEEKPDIVEYIKENLKKDSMNPLELFEEQ